MSFITFPGVCKLSLVNAFYCWLDHLALETLFHVSSKSGPRSFSFGLCKNLYFSTWGTCEENLSNRSSEYKYVRYYLQTFFSCVLLTSNATSNLGNLVILSGKWPTLLFVCIFAAILDYVICACASPSFDQDQADNATDGRVYYWAGDSTFLGGATMLGQDILYFSRRAETNKHQAAFVPSVLCWGICPCF